MSVYRTIGPLVFFSACNKDRLKILVKLEVEPELSYVALWVIVNL